MAKRLKNAYDKAHTYEVRLSVAMINLEVVQAMCAKFYDEAQVTEETKVMTEAKCSSIQVEILKVSSEMEEKIHMAIEEAMRGAEGVLTRRVKEAQRLAMEAFLWIIHHL